MLKKIKEWFTKIGLANILYLIISIGIWFIPIIPTYIKSHICVGALSIFIYINWNVIKKLIFKKKE